MRIERVKDMSQSALEERTAPWRSAEAPLHSRDLRRRSGGTGSDYSKWVATSSSSLRMGRCWGHMASQRPHLMQSEALPCSRVRRS